MIENEHRVGIIHDSMSYPSGDMHGHNDHFIHESSGDFGELFKLSTESHFQT